MDMDGGKEDVSGDLISWPYKYKRYLTILLSSASVAYPIADNLTNG